MINWDHVTKENIKEHNPNWPQIDNAKDMDVVINMHNLIEYSNNYSKISRSFW